MNLEKFNKLFNDQHYDEALLFFRNNLNNHTNRGLLLQTKAEYLFEQKKFTYALKYFEEAYQAELYSDRLFLYLALTLTELNQPREALFYFSKIENFHLDSLP